MRPPKKITAWGLAIVGLPILLFGVIPNLFWPAPTVEVDFPKEQSFEQDLPVGVTISAWHSNALLRNVRFYIDVAKTTAHSENERLPTTVLFNSGKPAVGMTFGNVSRLTWPQSKTVTLNLPLAKWAQENKVQPGLLVGKIDVELSYPRIQRPLTLFFGHTRVQKRVSVPLSIQLVR